MTVYSLTLYDFPGQISCALEAYHSHNTTIVLYSVCTACLWRQVVLMSLGRYNHASKAIEMMMHKQFAQPFLKRVFDGMCRLYILGVMSGLLLLVLSFLIDLITVQLYPLKGQLPEILLFLMAQAHRVLLSFDSSFVLMVLGIVLLFIKALAHQNSRYFQKINRSPAEQWNRALFTLSKVLLDMIKIGLVIFIGFLVMVPALLTSLQGSFLVHFPLLILMIFIASFILRRLIAFRNATSASDDAAHVTHVIDEKSQKHRDGGLSVTVGLSFWALMGWYLQTALITLSGLIVIICFLRSSCQKAFND